MSDVFISSVCTIFTSNSRVRCGRKYTSQSGSSPSPLKLPLRCCTCYCVVLRRDTQTSRLRCKSLSRTRSLQRLGRTLYYTLWRDYGANARITQKTLFATFSSTSWIAQVTQSARSKFVASFSSWAKSTRTSAKHCRITKDKQWNPEVICIFALYAAPTTYADSYICYCRTRLTKLCMQA